MSDTPMHEMTIEECWARLADTSFGRLATAALGEVTITPFNYVVDDRTLVFRTSAGTKLAEIVVESSVAVEIDDVSTSDAWSVICRGQARMVDKSDEVERLQGLGLHPWVDTEKEIWVVIDIDEVSGRRFQLAR